MPLQIKLASLTATLQVPTACPSRESQTIALWKLGAGGVRQPQQNTIHLCSHMGFSGAPWTHVFQFLVCFYLVSRVLKILPSFVIAFWGDLYSVSLYHGFQKSHPSRIKFNMRKRVKICDSLFFGWYGHHIRELGRNFDVLLLVLNHMKPWLFMMFLQQVQFYSRLVLKMWYVLKHQDTEYAQFRIPQVSVLLPRECGIIRSVALETSHQTEVLITHLQHSQDMC